MICYGLCNIYVYEYYCTLQAILLYIVIYVTNNHVKQIKIKAVICWLHLIFFCISFCILALSLINIDLTNILHNNYNQFLLYTLFQLTYRARRLSCTIIFKF